MDKNNNYGQLRITLSHELCTFVQEKSKQYGLTMAAYVRNLIIQDFKDTERPIYQAPLDIDKSVKMKKRFNWAGLDPMDG